METNSSIGIDIRPVQHLAEYVIGFPMHVAITVAAAPSVTLNGLRFADFLDLRDCIGAEIAGSAGQAMTYRPAAHASSFTTGHAGRLAPGELRRMLVDVSPYFDRAVEGYFHVRFSYVEGYSTYTAPVVSFALRRPHVAESALLAASAPDRPGFATWGEWTTSCATALAVGSVAPDNPLRFNLLLRRLICGPEPLHKVDPSILDVLAGLYAPEAHALQAELSQARGDRALYDGARSHLLHEAPGLAWWIRMLDRGSGFLKSLRFLP